MILTHFIKKILEFFKILRMNGKIEILKKNKYFFLTNILYFTSLDPLHLKFESVGQSSRFIFRFFLFKLYLINENFVLNAEM